MRNREFKITKAEEGAAFAVHIVPKSKKNEVVGKYGDALKIHLTSKSAGGTANEALLNFLAEKLNVDRTKVEIAGGHTSTEKMVIVFGLKPDVAEDRLLQ